MLLDLTHRCFLLACACRKRGSVDFFQFQQIPWCHRLGNLALLHNQDTIGQSRDELTALFNEDHRQLLLCAAVQGFQRFPR